MRKLKVILQILWADKWAVFTYEEVPEDPEFVTAPYFRWCVSSKDSGFHRLIKDKITQIEKEYYSIDDMFEDFKKKCKGE